MGKTRKKKQTAAQQRADEAQRVADAVTGYPTINLDEVEIVAERTERPSYIPAQPIPVQYQPLQLQPLTFINKKKRNVLDNVVSSKTGKQKLSIVIGKNLFGNDYNFAEKDNVNVSQQPNNSIFELRKEGEPIVFEIKKQFDVSYFFQEGFGINSSFSVDGSGISKRRLDGNIEVTVSLNGFISLQSTNQINWVSKATLITDGKLYQSNYLTIPTNYIQDKDNPYKPIGTTSFVLPKNVSYANIEFTVTFDSPQPEGKINRYFPLKFTINVPIPN